MVVLLASSRFALSQTTWQSSIVKFGSDGKLTYVSDAEQNRVIDFSYAGFKNSNVSLPLITNIITTLSPVAGDNTSAINSAIQAAASVTPDVNGFRGVILLNAGSYEIQGTILFNVSGVVLRGSGSGADGTVFVATGDTPHQRPVMVVGGGTHAQWVKSGSKTNITDPFVALGSMSLNIASVSGFAVGNSIVVYHPSTAVWIAAVDYGATDTDPAWTAGTQDIEMNRTITAINGNTITIDVPVTNHLNLSLSQSYIYKISKSTTKSLMGIEDLRIDIQNWTNEYIDENHAWWGVQMFDIEDSWARNVVVMHFGQSGFQIGTANRITLDNCQALQPVALLDGGQRDNFQIVEWTASILMTKCYATKGRHQFENSGTSQSGYCVFHRCKSVDPTNPSEGHMKWPQGLLYDCFRDSGSLPTGQNPGLVLTLTTNGNGGTSHGWSAAYSVIWNPDLRRAVAPHGRICVMKPSTAQNYCIGGYGESVNVNLEYPQYAVGYVEGFNNYTAQLIPESLFEQQLKDRLGSGGTAVHQNNSEIPKEFSLEQNYPNPFNPSTSIDYKVAKKEHIVLQVVNLLGEEIVKLVNEEKSPGVYTVQFSLQQFNLPSSVYLYTLVGRFGSVTKKMLYLK